jgi:hypothetical protein
MNKLLISGLTVVAICAAATGSQVLAATVTFNDEQSLRNVYDCAVSTFSNNGRFGRFFNYKEQGMIILDGVHPPDPALGGERFNHHHLMYENRVELVGDPPREILTERVMNGLEPANLHDCFCLESIRPCPRPERPGAVDPAELGRTLHPMGDQHVIQMTYDPDNDWDPVSGRGANRFNLVSILVLEGALNLGVRGPFGIAVYNNLTAGDNGTRWFLQPPHNLNLTRATIEGIGQPRYVVDDIVFTPSSGSATAALEANDEPPTAAHASEDPLDGEAEPVELEEPRDIVDMTQKVHDSLHLAFVKNVTVDIIPSDCRNEIEVARDTLEVAILGTGDSDVTEINPDTLLLEGIAPLDFELTDVETQLVPFSSQRCAQEERRDDFLDMVVQFDLQKILDTVGLASPAALRPLVLSGALFDGTLIEGMDAVVVPLND